MKFLGLSFLSLLYLFLVNLFAGPVHQPPDAAVKDSSGKNAITAAAIPPKDTSLTTASDSVKAKKHRDVTDTVRYESDMINYDAANRILRLTGKAKVKYQNMTLLADTIVYTMRDNLFTATGAPELIEDKDTTVGDFMAYNIKTHRGRVRYATTHVEGAYFSGQRIVKAENDELFVDKGDYSTCAIPDTPHYYFYGEHIRFLQNDKIISKPAVLNIGDAPVAALPYFIFPVERNRKSGILTPVWGGNPAGGGYVDNVGYYWAPNDYMDLTTCAQIREFSNFIVQASSHYALKYRLNGSIAGRYVFNSDFLSSQRQWAIDYSHNQNITPDGLTQLSGSGHITSTKNFYSTYSQDSSELSQALITSNLSLSRQFQDIKASGSIVWNRSQNLSNGDISQELPSVSFSLFDRPLIAPPSGVIGASPGADTATHWYNSVYWGYSSRGIVKSEVYGTNSRQTDFQRPGMSNEVHISAPQKIFKYITVSPNASANLSTFYGYMDTTVKGYKTTYDTNVYQLTNLTDTLQHTGYRFLSDSIGQIFSADSTITVHFAKMVSINPTTNPYYDTNKTSFANVFGWRTGASASTNLYGILPLHIFNFAGIRHTFSPSISYTYVPKHDLDKLFYNIGIGAEGAHDRQQNVNISIHNLFEGKIVHPPAEEGGKPGESKFTILSADVSTAYNFEAKGQKWSDMNLSASTGYGFLGLSFSSVFWLYDQFNRLSLPIMRNYSYSLSTGSFQAHGKLWDGDKLLLDSLRKADPIRDFNAGPQNWDISISPAYSFSASRATPTDLFIPVKNYNLNASASLGFTRNWKISWSGNYNFVADQMVQNSVNLSCDLECWEMKFQWRPEKLNPGYYFIINVKKIPDLKWEQKDRY
jgi:lipopolysaccharide assembly outer membrane protein LptD (OstA)